MEEHGLSPQANVLAAHFEAAGDRINAFHYWVKAGRQARNILAFNEALQAFERAQAILLQNIHMVLEDTEIAALYIPWEEIVYNVNDTETLEQLGTKLLHVGEERHSTMLIGVAHDILSDACFTVNDYQGGIKHTSQAIAHLEQSDYIPTHIQVYNHHGVFLYMMGRTAEAAEVFQEALALSANAKTIDEFRYRSHAHYQMALVRCFEGHPAQGRRHALLSIKDAETSISTSSLNWAYSISALAHYYLGDYQTSLEHGFKSIELGEKSRAMRLLGYAHTYIAMSALPIGKISMAYEHAQKAMQLGEEHGHNDVYALGCSQLGNVYIYLEDYPTALTLLQQGFEKGGQHFSGVYNLYQLGFTLHAIGQHAEGMDLMQKAEQGFEQYDIHLGAFLSRVAQTQAMAQAGQWEAVHPKAITVAEEARTHAMLPQYTLLTLILGQAALNEGHTQDAWQHAQEALSLARRLPYPWLEIQTLTLIHARKQQTAAPTTEIEEQLRSLLQQLGKSISHPELRSLFDTLASRIYQQTGISLSPQT